MKITKAIIPAAGFGTRMLPASKSVPKEMFPLGDRPVIHRIVEEAVASGITDILIITSRTKISIEDHFDYSPELEDKLRAAGNHQLVDLMRNISRMANITFLRQHELLGLGHAVWCGRKFTGDDPFAVLLGDDVMRSDVPVTKQLMEAGEKYSACVVGVQQVARELIPLYCTLDMSPIEGRSFRVNGLIEKPRDEQIKSLYSILGRYVLDKRVMETLENLPAGAAGEIQLTDALRSYCRDGDLVAVDFEGRRYDCGSLAGYIEASIDFALESDETAQAVREHIKKLSENF